jgi:hypothetical protein
VFTAAAWRLQRAHNPSYSGFSESPFSQAGNAAGFSAQDVTEENYKDAYEGIHRSLQTTPSILIRKGRELGPFLDIENREMKSSTEGEFVARVERMRPRRTVRTARAILSQLPGATTSSQRYEPPTSLGRELTTSLLTQRGIPSRQFESDERTVVSDDPSEYPVSLPSVTISIPNGTCSSCGGRGEDVLSAPLDFETTADIASGSAGRLRFATQGELSANPLHSAIHPKIGTTTSLSMDDLRGNDVKSVEVFSNMVVAKKSCTDCGGTGKESNA